MPHQKAKRASAANVFYNNAVRHHNPSIDNAAGWWFRQRKRQRESRLWRIPPRMARRIK